MKRMRAAAPVVTVWTDPDCVRAVDASAVAGKADMAGWIAAMTREENIALCGEKRIQTQVLFGDEVLIDEVHGGWAKVLVPTQPSAKDSRGYPGWVPYVQLSGRPKTAEAKHEVMIQSKLAPFFNEKKERRFDLSFGTHLPVIAETEETILTDSPVGRGYVRSKDVLPAPRFRPVAGGEKIVENAGRFVDLPYLWSGLSAYGYDCSGFSYSMLRASGYLIPRDADDQAVGGRGITADETRPGDLLFFAYDEGKGYVHHVGIYAGDGLMIHSPTPGKKVSRTALAGTFYEKELCAVRRYWQEAGGDDE